MPTIGTKGGIIFYDIKGQGDPIVIIKGFGFSSQFWMGYDDLLAQHFKVITIDNRGIGNSKSRISWFLTIDDMAQDIIEVLDHLGVACAHIFGIDLGGLIALSLGSNHKMRCRSLFLINTCISRLPYIGLLGKLFLFYIKYRRLTHLFFGEIADLILSDRIPTKNRDEILCRWQSLCRDEKPPFRAITMQLMAAVRFKPGRRIHHPDQEIFIIFGALDRLISNKESTKIYRHIFGSHLLEIEDGGHELSIDTPKKLCDAVIEFVRSNR